MRRKALRRKISRFRNDSAEFSNRSLEMPLMFVKKYCWLSLFVSVAFASDASACAVFTAPITYKKSDAVIDFDASPQAFALRNLAWKQYSTSVETAIQMEAAIDSFLRNPNPKTQSEARSAWKVAKRAYQLTEWTRFTESPIDWAKIDPRPEGPELRINAWPLNEAVMDYVRGAEKSGLVHRFDLAVTKENIIANDQVSDEADVTTGWHAVEFLLWGQDFSLTAAGSRPASDFKENNKNPNKLAVERRREYLRLVTALLIEDLTTVRDEWKESDAESYAYKLGQLPAIEQVGRSLHGATTLLVTELHGQRLTTPLDSGSPEDEHSCFSDFTLQDLQANLEGVRLVIESGDNNSLLALLRWRDPALADQISAQLDVATKAMKSIPEPFDAVLAAASNDPRRVQAERAANELIKLGKLMKASAESLGVDIVVPGV
jgi:putative iron-regulated protein